jgi:hypothetical protein
MSVLETPSLDMELIAQRILKLAEISTLEHLEALARSQADQLLELMDLNSDFPWDSRSV